MPKLLTLCIIHQGDRVLLGMKKVGFGAGRWNGFGGKVERGETPAEAAVREVREEAGIEVHDCNHAATLDILNDGASERIEVHVFRATRFSVEPRESDEMRPEWFPVDAIPYDAMFPDDRHWMPLVLAGKKIRASFTLGPDDTIEEMSLTDAAETMPSVATAAR